MFSGFRMSNGFEELRREVDRLCDGIGVDLAMGPFRTVGFPPVNVWDEGGDVVVEAEVPGIKREDLELSVTGDELTIKGTRNPVSGEQTNYQRQERGTGDFSRVVTLPVDVNAEGIDARLTDGVLTIRLPKAESARARRINIQGD